MAMEYVPPPAQTAYVLCADCGTPMEPNSAGLCHNCLRNSVDITEGIPSQSALSFCRNCSRYLSPPSTWLLADLESRELLAICLRKLKGLSKVRLIDAGFIWTEPHSKRLRVKLTIQKEVINSTILQQIFEVIFVVTHTQCPDCARLAAKNTWRALVQVRQKVDHKRTFLFLEQLILKHGADKDTVSVKEVKDGLDFFYATRQHAQKMVEFLNAVVPTRTKASEQLISLDVQNSTTNYKNTFSVELIPICKDDLVCLPVKMARSLSNISQLTVCSRVGNSIHLLDPFTLQQHDLSSPIYWRAPFPPLVSITAAIEFIVLDIEPTSHPPVQRGKFLLADAEVSPVKGSMDQDAVFHTRTHLGAILKPGDTVLGYHLTNANFNNDNFDAMKQERIPDVILIRKTYPQSKKKSKNRKWRLKSIAKEVGEGEHAGLGRAKMEGAGRRGPGAAEQAKAEADYERFLQDLEEDEAMRAEINLYKASRKPKRATGDAMDEDDTESVADTVATMEDDEDYPRIRVDELLDDMQEMTLEDDEVAEEVA